MRLHPPRHPTAPRGRASPTHRRSPATGPQSRPPPPRDPLSPGRPGPPPSGPRSRPSARLHSTFRCRRRSLRPGLCRHQMASPDPDRRRHLWRPRDPHRHRMPRARPALREERRISPSGPCRPPTADYGPASRHPLRPFPAVRPAMAGPRPASAGPTPTEHGSTAAAPVPARRPAGGDRFPSRRWHRRSGPPRTAPSAVWRLWAPTRTARPRHDRLRRLPAPPRTLPSNG
jgi:hypothetical protein